MRLISCFELKQKLLEERKKIYRMGGETTFGQATIHGIRIALRLMDQCLPQGEIMPVAVPVVHGRWIKDGDFLICLNCESEINIKNSLGVENRKNYCPNCGAKMDGGENDETN